MLWKASNPQFVRKLSFSRGKKNHNRQKLTLYGEMGKRQNNSFLIKVSFKRNHKQISVFPGFFKFFN